MGRTLIDNYVVIDLEMTGLNPKRDVILEVGAVRVERGQAVDTYSALLRTCKCLPDVVIELTGITQEMATAGMDPEEAMAGFFSFIGTDILVGQNIMYDYIFLKQWAANHRFSFERKAADTLKLARRFLPREEKKDLKSLCSYFAVGRGQGHRALDDAKATWQVFECLKAAYGVEHAEEFEPHPLLYKIKKQTPATPRQIAYIRKYAENFGIELKEPPEEMTRGEASRLVDGWITQYGKLPG